MRPLFQLGPRLALCAAFVRPGTRLVDIGTDHGYLPIWLLRQGIIQSAVAADINPGPLKAAQTNGERYETGDALTFRLSNGLREISPAEAEDIVVAGMGGELILRIVSETLWLRDGEKRLILQPMSSAPQLRLGLRDLGFEILEERAAEDGGKVYAAFSARYIGRKPDTAFLYPYLGKLRPGGPSVEAYAQRVVRDLENQLLGATHHGEAGREQELRELLDAVRREYWEKGDR